MRSEREVINNSEGFPHLANLLPKVDRRVRLYSILFDPNHVITQNLLRTAAEIAVQGTVTSEFYLGEDEPSVYQTELTLQEAEEYFEIIFQYFSFKNWLLNWYRNLSVASLMSPELESVLSGTAAPERYRRVSDDATLQIW